MRFILFHRISRYTLEKRYLVCRQAHDPLGPPPGGSVSLPNTRGKGVSLRPDIDGRKEKHEEQKGGVSHGACFAFPVLSRSGGDKTRL